MVEVVLLERIEKLGFMGDVVSVKPGYARNFLLPQHKALRATKENLAVFETRKAKLVADNLVRKADAEKLAAKMNDLKVIMVRQAGESGHLYGSVTARDIAETLGDNNHDIHRSQVVIDRPIKATGLHMVRVTLHPEVIITVTLSVASTIGEAESQIRRATPPEAPTAVEASPVSDDSATTETLQ
ncbi:MAG: 50S ribosomal protein L9 [Candidatus Pacebacteria bacterium]|nr:50S ribosomal protein L9 [Candidatus Paceibacterota bacterium]